MSSSRMWRMVDEVAGGGGWKVGWWVEMSAESPLPRREAGLFMVGFLVFGECRADGCGRQRDMMCFT